ncbi:MAG: PucR family transcriptional regulator ligand-binding domain-containing protein [Bacillota bacterium]
MKITVLEALKIGGLEKGSVLAGHAGLNNVIESVSVIEVPEATAWYKGGELFLTSLYSIVDNIEAQIQLIKNLSKYKCAGLVICHTGVYVKKIPQEIIQIADELAFPLIIVPPEIAYIDIISPLMDEILRIQSRKLKYSLDIHKKMTELVLAGKNSQELTNTLSNLLNKPVVVFDGNNNIVAISNMKLDDNQTGLLQDLIINSLERIVSSRKTKFTKISYLSKKLIMLFPVISGKQYYYGMLVIFNANTFSEMDRLAISHASTAFALASMKERTFEEIKSRIKRDFLEDLLSWNFHHESAAITRAKRLGWNLNNKLLVLIANIDGFFETYAKKGKNETELLQIKECFYNFVEDIVSQENFQNITINKSDTIIVLLHCEDLTSDLYKRAAKLGNQLIKQVEARINMTISVGVGSYVNKLSELPTSYNQALKALEIGKKLYGNQKCTLYKDLGIYPLLNEFIHEKKAMQWVKELFSELNTYDKINGTELSKTLKYLIDFNDNTAIVSTKLFVHKNTVLHRKKQIINILKANPFVDPHKFNFKIARELEKLNG